MVCCSADFIQGKNKSVVLLHTRGGLSYIIHILKFPASDEFTGIPIGLELRIGLGLTCQFYNLTVSHYNNENIV